MKQYCILIATAMLMTFSSCQQREKQSNEQNDVVGVYQYTGNIEGMSIWTEKYFVAGAKRINDLSTADSTDFYKNEYQSLLMEGGTWTMEDSIVTCTYLFAKNPSLVGSTFRFTYAYKGDTLYYHVLNDNDERIGGGSDIKLKPSGTQNDIIGVYRYTDPREGMAVMFDDYFVYILRQKHEPSPEDSEDYYENEYNSLQIEAGTYAMQDSIVSNYMLFNKNGKLPPQDEPDFRWAVLSNKADSFAVGIINNNGEINGEPMYSIRLE